jgi:RND family efflux transporter MFP subunit
MRFIVSILVVIVAVGATIGLYMNSPKTTKKKPKRPIPLVQTVAISPRSEQVYIEVFGTVIPAKQVALRSEVEGRVIRKNEELIPGGIINKGKLVAQIDPLDYQLLVNEREAEVAEARYALQLEEGQQVIAKEEWLLLEKEVVATEASKSLALREPHLRFVKAKLQAAESRLAAAKLSVKRTTINAPFNGLVLDSFVEQGQLISSQTEIATLVKTDQFWIQVTIPVARLSRIQFPDNGGRPGASARIIFENEDGTQISRSGTLFKLLGELDSQSRMAKILVTINDPLSLKKNITGNLAGSPGDGKILLGSYVKVEIDAGTLDNIFVVPRQAVHEGNVIWLLNRENRLATRPVDIVWRRQDEMLIRVDLDDSEKLIVSRLQSPLPGTALRNATEKEADNAPNNKKKR